MVIPVWRSYFHSAYTQDYLNYTKNLMDLSKTRCMVRGAIFAQTALGEIFSVINEHIINVEHHVNLGGNSINFGK